MAERPDNVEFHSDDDPSTVLRLSFEPDRSGIGLDTFGIEIHGPELNCETGALTAGGDGLAGFLNDLATSWRGWDGTRRWDALELGISIEATHHGNRVELLFIVRRDYSSDAWQVRLPIFVAPGESLSRLAKAAGELTGPRVG